MMNETNQNNLKQVGQTGQTYQGIQNDYNNDAICPHCGRCRHCGAAHANPYPYQYIRYYPLISPYVGDPIQAPSTTGGMTGMTDITGGGGLTNVNVRANNALS